MRLYGCVGRLVHGGHSGTVVFPWKPMSVHFQLDRTDCWVEVEETLLRGRVREREREREGGGGGGRGGDRDTKGIKSCT